MTLLCQSRPPFLVFDFWMEGVSESECRERRLLVWGANMDVTRVLAISAAGIDCRDSKGQTALKWAGIRGDHKAIRVLLSFGANPNLASNTGNTPLLQAARSSAVTSVKYLIEAGADMNWKNRQHFTALHYAIYYRDDRHMIEELNLKGEARGSQVFK